MPSPDQTIRLFAPAAAALLEADADAIRCVTDRRDEFVLLDPQPAATAMAARRRAEVATKLRTQIAPRQGWSLRSEHLAAGAYEWETEDGVLVRLSKTTRESRQEAALASLSVQASLFELPRVASDAEDILLMRLNGNPLMTPSMDVAQVTPSGEVVYRIAVATIARSTTEPVAGTNVPSTQVRLPGEKRRANGQA